MLVLWFDFFFLDVFDGVKFVLVFSNIILFCISFFSLICWVDVSFEVKFCLFFNGSFIEISSLGIFNVIVMFDGVYICVFFNEVGDGKNVSVSVLVVGEFIFRLIYLIVKIGKLWIMNK